MIDRMHLLLVLLTLIDLAFVQATGAVDAINILPLWLFTIASVGLRRLQRFRTYRFVWNLGVLVVFTLLVHHATTTGLLHMLEDGLILAVLCQVHLVNNIGDKQRPDLTFFNSFLIAFVTSFFAQDMSWSLLFLLHTLVFVPGLQVYAMTRQNDALPRDVFRATMRDGLRRTFVVTAVTALVFAFWPRDFHREGWLQDRMTFGQDAQAGLAERIELERTARAQLDDEIVLRIEASSGDLGAVPSHWRGLAFLRFDGRTWYPQDAADLGSRFATDTQWRRQSDGTWQRPSSAEPHTTLRVQLAAGDTGRLLLPLGAVLVEPANLGGRMLDAKSYAGFALLHTGSVNDGPLTYRVGLGRPQPIGDVADRTRRHLTQLPDQGVPDLAYDLSRRIKQDLPLDCDALTLADAMAQWLQQNRRYQLPGEPDFARNLGEFLFGSAAGHCEYFATTLALLLRCEGVPCRVVGGFLVHERSADGRAMIARCRDAHAWVEVLAADGSWHRFDGTPASDVRRRTQVTSGILSTIGGWLQSLWSTITGFDEHGRSALLQRLLAVPRSHPLTTAACLVLCVCLWLRRRHRRRQSRQPAIADLQRAMRRARLQLQPGETPRELLARLPAELPTPLADELARSVQAHERARYR